MDRADALIAVCADLARRGWVPATSGNMSVRHDAETVWLTASGGDKGRLTRDQLLHVRLSDGAVLGTAGDAATGRPSAETLLHLQVYRRRPSVGAVLHVHSPTSTKLGRRLHDRPAVIAGLELMKALRGIATHEARVEVPCFPNTQDMTALARDVDRVMADGGAPYGYLIAGHGLYAWGETLADAARHTEALDVLLDVVLDDLLHGPPEAP